MTVARANAVKNVCVRTPQIGSRKTAKINFTHFVGTVSGSDCAIKSLDGVRATLRMTFPPRFELRAPRFFFDLRLVAAKVAADYAECGHFGKAKFTSSGEHRPLACSSRQPAEMLLCPRAGHLFKGCQQAAGNYRLAACAPQTAEREASQFAFQNGRLLLILSVTDADRIASVRTDHS